IAFENTVRQKIDPGLVEKTKGNNFRTRVYPIPSKGYKRVVIGMEQKLTYQNDKLVYLLPLQAKETIDELSIEANVFYNEKPILETESFAGFAFRHAETGYEGEYERKAFAGDHLFGFSLPFKDDDRVVYTEEKDGKTYFFVNGRLNTLQVTQKLKPSRITLLWDISSSADKRNREKEFVFLKGYLASLQNVQVQVVPFHIAPQPVQTFSIQNGETNDLISKLKELVPEGGTQLGALNLSAYKADVFLLFSDGLSTFGKKEIQLTTTPIITVNSSSSPDFSYLKYAAQQTGGNFIDLTKLNAVAALQQINDQALQVNSKKVTGNVEELITTVDVSTNSYSAAGILKSDEAELELVIGKEDPMIKTTVIKNEEQTEGIARIWASMQIDQLDMQYEKNKERITALGKQFSIVTQNTSLIVLDRVEDYVEHEIVPPVELQKEYYALLKGKQQEKADDKTLAIEEALQAMNDLKNWWNAGAFKGKKQKMNTTELVLNRQELEQSGVSFSADSSAVYHFETAPNNSAGMSPPPPPPPGTPGGPPQEELSEVSVANGIGSQFKNEDKAPEKDASTITIAKWKPDAPYLKTLEKTS
ncbi:MAG TPA: hypothetical protein VGB71_12675, partial [Flavisolibacter sp.]